MIKILLVDECDLMEDRGIPINLRDVKDLQAVAEADIVICVSKHCLTKLKDSRLSLRSAVLDENNLRANAELIVAVR